VLACVERLIDADKMTNMVAIEPLTRPILLVVVDTEEEFDWGAGFDRGATAVSAMAEIGRFQSVCDTAGVHPCYVIDYPVASQPEGYEQLQEYAAAGRCEIGAHLHPWVNPPFDEAVNARNSYPGNLEPELESAKLEALRDTIAVNFGSAPRTYKAGRYGSGPNTPGILEALGFQIDLSAAPCFDLRADGGPDFRFAPADPTWSGAQQRMLSLPTTGGFTGLLSQRQAARLFFAGDSRLLQAIRWRGWLSRLGIAHQQRLSPEGYTLDDNKRLTRQLLAEGHRVLSFSFHSPSLKPGCTAYATSAQEVNEFLDRIRAYIEFFLEELGGEVLTPTQTRDRLVAADQHDSAESGTYIA